MIPDDVPWERLGIPASVRPRLSAEADRATRLACTQEPLALAPDVYAAAMYVLAIQGDGELREAAIAAVRRIPNLVASLGQGAHAKVLEFLAEIVRDPALDIRILQIHNTNDRTALLITRRADRELCGIIADNHERLLITPEILVALHQNPACGDDAL